MTKSHWYFQIGNLYRIFTFVFSRNDPWACSTRIHNRQRLYNMAGGLRKNRILLDLQQT